MAQRLTTSFVNTVTPGAYPNITVKSNPAGLGASGIVVIMGEAEGGPSYTEIALKDNFFSPDQAAQVEQQYIAGPIVDAMRALAAPSNDADITGTVNRVYIVKTNTGTKASALVDTNYGTLKSKNWGKDGNKYKYQITNSTLEVAPTVSGSTIASFGAALNGLTFSIRLSGGAATAVTLSATAGDHNNIANLIIELNTLLPVGITASAGTAPDSLKLTVAADVAANRKGWGKSFELVDTDPGDLAAIGLVAGLVASSAEPEVELAISRTDTGLNELIDIASNAVLMIGYQGTTATIAINQTAKILTTTVTGGSGANLSIDLSSYRTIADLVAYISAQTGYSASVIPAAQQLNPSTLDEVSAQGIASSAAGLKAGRIKNGAYSFQSKVSTSSALDFTPTAKAGIPTQMTAGVFLSGGAKGGTLAADVVDAVDQMAGVQCNIILPLFSRDASDDIADAMTESSSTYTIDAVHALVKNHCVQYSTPKLKRHRMAILSYWGTFADTKSKSQGIANYRCSLAFQRVSQVNSSGEVVSYLPWYGACIAAGMQAGGFYKAIVNKAANVISYTDPSGYDSGSPGDVEEALEAGLLMLAQDPARNYWVSDQTTYSFDTNFVYNSIQAVYLSDILVLDLTQSFQTTFVGKSLADVDAAVGLSFLATKMDGYRRLKMIAASTDAPLGYKNAKVSISAPVMSVSCEIKLATAIYFIPLDISISAVQSEAA